MTTQFLRKFSKIGGAIAISLALSLTACGSEPALDDVDADVEVPEDQAAVPDGAEVGGDNAADELEGLVGETVTISTKVTEVLSPNLFTAFDEESMRGEEILIVTDILEPAVGDNVEVTGEVMTFDAETIDEAYVAELEPAVVEAYTGKPYIAAQGIEAVD